MNGTVGNPGNLFRVIFAIAFLACAGAVSAGQEKRAADGDQVTLQSACGQLPPGGVCLRLDDGKIELLHVQGNVFMIAGAGPNITVQIGDDDVMVVDAGLAEASDHVLSAIRRLTKKHILFIVDTSADRDHTGGNANLSKAGMALPDASQNPSRAGEDFASGAPILAHINVLRRMSEPPWKESPLPSDLWPTDPYESRYWRIYNGEAVYLVHPPNAHTDGDTFVQFRRSDVLSIGDLMTLSSYPVIEAGNGGKIDGLIDALNQIIELLVPKDSEEAGTYVIPGHGRICDRNDVVNYRDMVTIIRGRIQSLIDKGLTLDQVQSAKPTFDYDGVYGSTTGPWTNQMFVEAIYKDLSGNKKQQPAGGGKQ